MTPHRTHPRALALTTILLLVAGSAAASPSFASPGIEGVPQAETPINITVSVLNNLSEPAMVYKNVEHDSWDRCTIKNSRCSFTDGLPEGLYQYYFINSTNTSTRFPRKGSLLLPLSDGIDDLMAKAENLTQTDSSNTAFGDSCTPWNNSFSCSLEPIQGAMINGFSLATLMTQNTTYRNKTANLSLIEYDNSGATAPNEIYATCDIDNSDYDCQDETGNEPNPDRAVAAGQRQGSLIASLGKAGRLLNHSTIKGNASNYMDGKANGCNIWKGDYDCTTLKGQGKMTVGAWESYLATGNSTYRQHASALSKETYQKASATGNTGKPLLLALLKAGQLTGNTSYTQLARNKTQEAAEHCFNRTGTSKCSIENQTTAIQAALDGYKQTGDSLYRQLAFNGINTNTSGDCNPWDSSYSCSEPEKQGKLINTFWDAYRTLPDAEPAIAAPRLIGTKKVNAPKTFSITLHGDTPQPQLRLKKQDDAAWTTCPVHLGNTSCTLNASTVKQQGIYEYQFTAATTELPANGSFRFIASPHNETLRKKAGNLSINGTTSCNPWENDFSCNFVHWQGWSISGKQEAFQLTQNTTYNTHLSNLSVTEYDISDANAVCDHADNDFNCDPTDNPTGSYRQGRIIESLWNAHIQTQNTTIRRIAHNYTTDHPDDCNIWQNDYSCASDAGQGQMISGLITAYKATGNTTYLQKARSLADTALSISTNSTTLLSSLWKLSGVTANTTYQNHAKADTLSSLSQCADGSCSVINYSEHIIDGITMYTYAANSTYKNRSFMTLNTGNTGPCSIWDGDYKCIDADQQGALETAVWAASGAEILSVDGKINFTATEPTILTGTNTTVTCTVENEETPDSPLQETTLNLSGPQFTIYNSTNTSLGTIEPGNSSAHNWTVSSTTEGAQTLTCEAETTNDWDDQENLTITVETPTTESDDGGGGGSGGETTAAGGGGGFAPPTRSFVHDLTQQETVDSLTDLLDHPPGYRTSLETLFDTTEDGVDRIISFTAENSQCLTARRNETVLQENVKYWLSVEYTCDTFLEKLSIRETVETHFSNLSINTSGEIAVLNQQPGTINLMYSNISRGETLTTKYTTPNKTRFSAPLILLKNTTIPPPDTTPPAISVTSPARTGDLLNLSTDTVQFNIQPSDRNDVTCIIERNQRPVQEFSGSTNTSIPVVTGWNYFNIECTDTANNTASEQVKVYRAPEQPANKTRLGSQEQSTGIAATGYDIGILLSLLVLLASIIYLSRHYLIRLYKYGKLGYLLLLIQYYFRTNNIRDTVPIYKEARTIYIGLYDQRPPRSFWDTNIHGFWYTLRIYLLIDLVSKNLKQDNPEQIRQTMDHLQKIYGRFKNEYSGEIVAKVQKKLTELNIKLGASSIDSKLSL